MNPSLNSTQTNVLNALKKGYTISEVAAECNISQSAVYSAVRFLIHTGYVKQTVEFSHTKNRRLGAGYELKRKSWRV